MAEKKSKMIYILVEPEYFISGVPVYKVAESSSDCDKILEEYAKRTKTMPMHAEYMGRIAHINLGELKKIKQDFSSEKTNNIS